MLARPYPGLMEEGQQLRIPLVQANYDVLFSRDRLTERQFAPAFPLRRGGGQDSVPVWAGAGFAELLFEFGFKGGRDGMFKTFGLLVNFVPFHSENFTEHSFDEVMAQR